MHAFTDVCARGGASEVFTVTAHDKVETALGCRLFPTIERGFSQWLAPQNSWQPAGREGAQLLWSDTAPRMTFILANPQNDTDVYIIRENGKVAISSETCSKQQKKRIPRVSLFQGLRRGTDKGSVLLSILSFMHMCSLQRQKAKLPYINMWRLCACLCMCVRCFDVFCFESPFPFLQFLKYCHSNWHWCRSKSALL